MIGLVGYHCRTGLGYQNRQIAQYGGIDRWLVIPHSKQPTFPALPEVDTTLCNSRETMERFIRSVDTVLFCESPKAGLLELCAQYDKRTVCIPNQEWLPEKGRGWPQRVSLFVCPTEYTYRQFANLLPCVMLPWPVDTERFPFVERTTCNQFLCLEGNGGYKGRKGTEPVKLAKELWPDFPLLVRTDDKRGWPRGTEFLEAPSENDSLYSAGDVLLAPHCCDGIGLEPMEAMAAGMPVITTDGCPWNENPALTRLPATVSQKRVQRVVDWYSVTPESIVTACKNLLGTDIRQASHDARQWAESRSWLNQSLKGMLPKEAAA